MSTIAQISNGEQGSTIRGKINASFDAHDSEAIQLLRLHDPNLVFSGFVNTGTATPAHVANKAYIATASGTIFGVTGVTKGQIIKDNGTVFSAENVGLGKLSKDLDANGYHIRNQKNKRATQIGNGVITVSGNSIYLDSKVSYWNGLLYDANISFIVDSEFVWAVIGKKQFSEEYYCVAVGAPARQLALINVSTPTSVFTIISANGLPLISTYDATDKVDVIREGSRFYFKKNDISNGFFDINDYINMIDFEPVIGVLTETTGIGNFISGLNILKPEGENIFDSIDNGVIAKKYPISLNANTGELISYQTVIYTWNAFLTDFKTMSFRYKGIPQFIIVCNDSGTSFTTIGIGNDSVSNYNRTIHKWTYSASATFVSLHTEAGTSPAIGDIVTIKIISDRVNVYYNGELQFSYTKSFLVSEGATTTNYRLGIVCYSWSSIQVPTYVLGGTQLDRLDFTDKIIGSVTDTDKLNLNISILGDSISTNGGAASVPDAQCYWGLLQNNENCTIYRNAIGGSGIADNGGTVDFPTTTRWQSLNSVIDPDIILIFGGVNDFLQGVVIGDETTPSTDHTKIWGALRYLYDAMLTLYPNAHIYHMTPAHNQYTQGGTITPVKPEFNDLSGIYLNEYVEAIKSVAQLYGIGIIDVYQESGITAYNIGGMSSDDIHFNAVGHNLVYELILKSLK